MTEAPVGETWSDRPQPSTLSRLLWVTYQAVAITTLGVIVWEVLGWREGHAYAIAAASITLLPQLATTYNLMRVARPAPSLMLWLALTLACAIGLGAALWATTRELHEAVLIGVAAFALAPAYLALWFSGWSSTERRRWLVQGINLLSACYVLLIAGAYVFAHETQAFAFSPVQVLSLFALVIAQPIIASLWQAFADGRLPISPGGQPELKHISGLGAIFAVLFTASIAGLGVWAAFGQNGFHIHRNAGLVVAGGLAMVFLLVAIAPNFQATDRAIQWTRNTGVIKFVSGLSSTLDGILVFAFGGAMGTSQPNDSLRYGLLIANLSAAGILGWWLPPPYGMAAILWAFLCALAVARRWAWIEEDRENAMLNRNFDGPHIRVGFEQDLRDEALFGFTAILILAPLALRQMHEAFGSHLFLVAEDANVDHILPWLTFFGTELAKAVPFVDWAEIYQVRGDAPIQVDDAHVGLGQHVIFATRVLVDLVLLAALLQAVAVSQRASKLRDMFYFDRTLTRLDPFVEARAFKKLVTQEGGAWKLNEPLPSPFVSYDEDRLEALQTHPNEAVRAAAAEILRMQSAELLLVEEAKLPTPDASKLELYLERAQSRGSDVAIPELRAAHFLLNDRGILLGVREQIITVIALHWRADQAVGALCEILMGQIASDRRNEARLVALNGLHLPAMNGDRGAQVAIRYASTHDAASRIRELAAQWIDEHPDWGT